MTSLPSEGRLVMQSLPAVTRKRTIDTPADRPTIGISRSLPPQLETYVYDDSIRKADVLIEAMSWIRRFRDRLIVIKLGGSALEDRETVSHLLTDVIFMETVG